MIAYVLILIVLVAATVASERYQDRRDRLEALGRSLSVYPFPGESMRDYRRRIALRAIAMKVK